jgi:hypothetical protein
MPNPSIKDEKLYQDLRKQGDSKDKAARIANAAAAHGRSSVGKSGGKSALMTTGPSPNSRRGPNSLAFQAIRA